MRKIKILLAAACLNIFSQQAVADFNELEDSAQEYQVEYGPGFWIEDPSIQDPGHEETSAPLLTPQDLEERDLDIMAEIEAMLRFPQTFWNECTASPSGNYTTYGCTARRGISTILESYLKTHFMSCVDEALGAQGGGRAQTVHITHAGITGDPRHSPRSLHAENRAIDVKSIQVKLSNGTDRQFTYSLTGNRPFYTALRRCWGGKVNRHNGCPLASGKVIYTGSIGWEDKNHGSHMHLSVPYCVNGRYGTGFFQR